MSKVVVEEINKIELDSKTWWQPEIDKKMFKSLTKRDNSKAWFHTILYFSILLLSGVIAFLTWGTWFAIPAFFIYGTCLLYTSPSPRDATLSRMPSSA